MESNNQLQEDDATQFIKRSKEMLNLLKYLYENTYEKDYPIIPELIQTHQKLIQNFDPNVPKTRYAIQAHTKKICMKIHHEILHNEEMKITVLENNNDLNQEEINELTMRCNSYNNLKREIKRYIQTQYPTEQEEFTTLILDILSNLYHDGVIIDIDIEVLKNTDTWNEFIKILEDFNISLNDITYNKESICSLLNSGNTSLYEFIEEWIIGDEDNIFIMLDPERISDILSSDNLKNYKHILLTVVEQKGNLFNSIIDIEDDNEFKRVVKDICDTCTDLEFLKELIGKLRLSSYVSTNVFSTDSDDSNRLNVRWLKKVFNHYINKKLNPQNEQQNNNGDNENYSQISYSSESEDDSQSSSYSSEDDSQSSSYSSEDDMMYASTKSQLSEESDENEEPQPRKQVQLEKAFIDQQQNQQQQQVDYATLVLNADNMLDTNVPISPQINNFHQSNPYISQQQQNNGDNDRNNQSFEQSEQNKSRSNSKDSSKSQ